ncbi:MAG: hypothetical protein ABL982_21585 [Vicinamibacterales bacterium]
MFSWTAIWTLLLDWPAARARVSHEAADEAVQLQPVSVAMSTDRVPPAALIESLVRFRL